MYGRVTKYFHNKGYGFIHGEDSNTYFIHHTKLNGEFIALQGIMYSSNHSRVTGAITTQKILW